MSTQNLSNKENKALPKPQDWVSRKRPVNVGEMWLPETHRLPINQLELNFIPSTTHQTNQLPNEEAFRAELRRSRRILEWEDNWDGDGSPGYVETTWQRAADFTLKAAMRLWSLCYQVIEVPRVSPGPDGSIDIHWKTSKREMLINIPVEAGELAEYYGESTTGETIKGKLHLSANNEFLLSWLTR